MPGAPSPGRRPPGGARGVRSRPPRGPAGWALWRDPRFLRLAGQAAFLAAVLALAAYLHANLRANLARLGLSFGLGFLDQPASFGIGEAPIPFRPTDPYGRAFMVGVLNTLRVAAVGIPLATLLGAAAGVARLSRNALVRGLAGAYVELVRNTPLLAQLFFWYMAVFVSLPRPQEARALPGPVYLSNAAIALPRPRLAPGGTPWLLVALAGLAAAALVYRWRVRRRVEQGRETRPGLWAAAVALSGLALAALPPGPVLVVDVPARSGFGLQGGIRWTPEFAALVTGLVVYTGAFIAEVVRGGLLAVPRGQWEAARALGLSPWLVLRLVVFPQALRVIIPPLTSQYLNLVKNSSLAVAIGYPDLFNVASTIFNQTGRAVEVTMLVAGIYLAFSLFTSLLMNLYNRAVRFAER